MMKKGILFVLAAAFLASCQQEENEGVASVDRVTITPIITRATEVNFEDQDQIGDPDSRVPSEETPPAA